MTTLFVRLWASVPILVVLLYATGGRLTASTLRRTAPAGVLFGLNLACAFTALHHATVAVVSVMSALQPGLVLVIAALVLKERITPTQVIWTAVGIGGAALVILGAGKQVHTSTLGLTLSILAMVTFTIYFLLAKRIRTTTPIGAFEWMAGATLFSALTITPFTLLTDARHHFGDLAGNDLLELAFVTIITGIAGHVLMSWVTKYIDASRSSLYLLAMNVIAVSAAWPLHHEPITVVQALGGAVVLCAVAVVISRPPTMGGTAGKRG